ncbi:MAG: DsbA family protein [Alphaproteobacteria bacterium]|nr:DsbA family protein [Alphaproteobacteria bacterium]
MLRFQTLFRIVAVLGLALAPMLPGMAADNITPIDQDIDFLKKGQAEILRQLQELRKLLEDRGTLAKPAERGFQPVDIDVASAPSQGDLGAPVVLVEFTDFQCPFCRRHSSTVMAQIEQSYVATGKIRYVVREFPIGSLHPQAPKAAEAALCAGEQGRYWDMHALLFRNANLLDPASLFVHAQTLGLDRSRFEGCMVANRFADQVRADFEAGTKVGVRGTPSFFIGLADPKDPSKMRATELISGAQPFEAFQRAIDELLAQHAG